MKISFRNSKKTWIQLTDGSAIGSNYLLEKVHNRLDIDLKSHNYGDLLQEMYQNLVLLINEF